MAIQVWLAALIVGVAYLAVAGLLVLIGKQRVQSGMPPKPDQTMETIQEDVQWVKTQAR